MKRDSLKEFIEELREIWVGSGYSIKSICRNLESSGLASEKPFDESVPRIFFGKVEDKYIVINVTMAGYELLEPLKA
jgi:hypothetical protein